MIKRLKNYLSFKKRMQTEVLETLASICLYLDYDGHYGKNRYAEYMRSHFTELKALSEELRKGKQIETLRRENNEHNKYSKITQSRVF